MSVDHVTVTVTDAPQDTPSDDEASKQSVARRLLVAIADRTRLVCTPLWADRRIHVAIAIAAASGWGLLAGWWTPRGPLTTGEALWSIAISLTIGGIAGLVSRSRWTMCSVPVAFAVVFELVRAGTDGPTVDGLAGTTYGLYAFVVGRGFHALVSLLPMIFGAAVGAGAARRLDLTEARPDGRRVGRYARRGVAILATVGLAAFTIVLARPASTDPIVDAAGNVIPGSVAELTTIDVSGHDLALMIRGHSVDNPVMLFLVGGPGGSEMGAMRKHLPELEEHFTVVTWDQRGSGKSYPELDPTDTITLDGFVDDTTIVTDYLRDRFAQDRIYLLGNSWGTILGVLAVQQHPERYAAFIGTGQMVSPLATDTIFYDDALIWARNEGDTDLVADLVAIGAPPYDRMLDYETALTYEHDVYPYDHSTNSEGVGGFSENIFVEEYALIDQIHILGAFMETFSVLYPQLQGIDFRDTATSFEIPMFFVEGAHEAGGRAEPFEDWYPNVEAPIKELAVLDTSGHRPLFEQPDEFVDYMVDTVLARTQDSEGT
jgi:pimeloyl-ACP methyl ester carboxylesterase